MTSTFGVAPGRSEGIADVTAGAARVLDLLVRARLVLIALASVLYTVSLRSDSDWALLVNGGRAVFGAHGTRAYVANPSLQAGPPSIVAAFLIQHVFGYEAIRLVHLLMGLELPLLLWMVEPLAAGAWSGRAPIAKWTRHAERLPDLARLMTLVCGLLIAPVWASLADQSGHIDDALALLAACSVHRFVSKQQWISAGLTAGVAVALKPWAVAVLPSLLGLHRNRRRAWALALAVPALSWAPFVIGASGTIDAGARNFVIGRYSTWHVLGLLTGDAPPWARTAEIIGELLFATIAARRIGWPVALAAGMVGRLLLDITTLDYYASTAVAALCVAELLIAVIPWRTSLTVFATWLWPLEGWPEQGQVRLSILGLVALSLVMTSRSSVSHILSVNRSADARSCRRKLGQSNAIGLD